MVRSGRTVGSRIRLAAVVVIAVCVACGRDESPKQQPAQAAVRDTVRHTRDTILEAGGEVVSDSVATTAVKERWITDANVLSLLTAMNARQIAAADIELSSWHSDTVRAFAASMAREHAQLQHGVDSMVSRLDLTPTAPALAKPWLSAMQAQIDTMLQARGEALDRAFVRQQTSSHQLMGEYIRQLAAGAERAELRGFLETAASRVASQLQRARSLETTLAAADSAAAARRAARKRSSTPQ